MMQSTEAKLFAKPQLKAVIEQQGRQQSWLARKTGISKTMMSHVMAGRRTLTNSQATSIAETLGLPLFLLFELPDGKEVLTVRNEAEAAA